MQVIRVLQSQTATIAIERNITFGFYADTYGCFSRPWFNVVIPRASLLFVVNEDEVKKAKEFFPNISVFSSGNSVWEHFAFPKHHKDELREIVSVGANSKVVLCPLGKNLIVNILHLGGVVEAVVMTGRNDLHVVAVLHPGDRNDIDIYNDLTENSQMPVVFISSEEMSAPDLVSITDVMVESASTFFVGAAFQQKPCISYFTEIALNRIEQRTGSREWKPCEEGVSIEIHGNPKKLAKKINELLDPNTDTAIRLREMQKKLYPKPAKNGQAVDLMMKVLLSSSF